MAKNTRRSTVRGRKLAGMQVIQSTKLANVCYDIRGPVLEEAQAAGGGGAPHPQAEHRQPGRRSASRRRRRSSQDIIRNLPTAHGYSDSKGLLSARRAVVQHYQTKGIDGVDVEDVYLGNGVSELIVMAMQALLDDGDEVLDPGARTTRCGPPRSRSPAARPVHYLCDEQADWMPDLDDIEREDHRPHQGDRRSSTRTTRPARSTPTSCCERHRRASPAGTA